MPDASILTDPFGRPLKDLRISLIDKCNFRCGYCMPNHKKYTFLPKKSLLTTDEIINFSEVFSELGVEKIRLTGGEPLLRKEVVEIVKGVKTVAGICDVAMTTNGYLLQKYASALFAAGLDRLTVSLDTVDAKLFRYMSGGKADITPVLAGIDAAVAAGFRGLKVNMVVQKGINDQHIVDVCRYFKDKPVQVRFIEYMDVGHSNDWNMESVYTASAIEQKPQKKQISLCPHKPQIRQPTPRRHRIPITTSIHTPLHTLH